VIRVAFSFIVLVLIILGIAAWNRDRRRRR
jgi:hypothetical protein